MTLDKNGKVIFATHKEKITQSQQVPPSNYDKTLNSPFLFPHSPTKILENSPH